MTIQVPKIYVDNLVKGKHNLDDILSSLLTHSDDPEESEELDFCAFIMEADLSTLDEKEDYRIHSHETNQ